MISSGIFNKGWILKLFKATDPVCQIVHCAKFRKLVKLPGVVGIGEIGLDRTKASNDSLLRQVAVKIALQMLVLHCCGMSEIISKPT
jgi:Tat protein secretion system quality control protein TatD with DNase activity